MSRETPVELSFLADSPVAAWRFDRLAGLQHWELAADRTQLATTCRAPSLAVLGLLIALCVHWAPRMRSLPRLTVHDGWLSVVFQRDRPLEPADLAIAELVEATMVGAGLRRTAYPSETTEEACP